MRRAIWTLPLVCLLAFAVSALAQPKIFSPDAKGVPPRLVVVGPDYTVPAGIASGPTGGASCDPYSYYPDPTCDPNPAGGPNYGSGTSAFAEQHFVPHIVSGGGFVTTITITNLTNVKNSGQLLYWGQDGATLSRTAFALPAGATMRLQTPEAARFAPSATQWLTVSTAGDVGINSFFELKDASGKVTNTIGFNDPLEGLSFCIPVEFAPGSGGLVGRTVGLAIADDTSDPAAVTMNLFDGSGKLLASAVRMLPAFAQIAVDLSTMPEFASKLPPSDFVGTVTLTSDHVISHIALEDDLGPFYSTPGLPYGEKGQMVVPHILSGGGFVTFLTLMNMDTIAANTFDVKFYDPSGKLLQQQSLTVASNGAARISTPESARFGATQVSWAVITSSTDAAVNSFFELKDGAGKVVNTIGFNHADPETDFTVPVEFVPGTGGNVGRTVGVAIANPSSTAANVTLKLVDATGTVVATSTLTISPNAQQAIDLSTLSQFKAVLPPSDFVGVLTVTSNVPVSTIALGDDFGPFYSTPVMLGRAQ